MLVTLATSPDTPSTPGISGKLLEEYHARVTQLEADVACLQALLSEVIGERDYLRQVHTMALASQQKLVEAPRSRWRWPWS